MDQQNNKRNSILKKTIFEDGSPTQTQTFGKLRRRISFSGKKSIKEFRDGEDKATIWGTSYEESADAQQLSSDSTNNEKKDKVVMEKENIVFNTDKSANHKSIASCSYTSSALKHAEHTEIPFNSSDISMEKMNLNSSNSIEILKNSESASSEKNAYKKILLSSIHLLDGEYSQLMNIPSSRFDMTLADIKCMESPPLVSFTKKAKDQEKKNYMDVEEKKSSNIQKIIQTNKKKSIIDSVPVELEPSNVIPQGRKSTYERKMEICDDTTLSQKNFKKSTDCHQAKFEKNFTIQTEMELETFPNVKKCHFTKIPSSSNTNLQIYKGKNILPRVSLDMDLDDLSKINITPTERDNRLNLEKTIFSVDLKNKLSSAKFQEKTMKNSEIETKKRSSAKEELDMDIEINNDDVGKSIEDLGLSILKPEKERKLQNNLSQQEIVMELETNVTHYNISDSPEIKKLDSLKNKRKTCRQLEDIDVSTNYSMPSNSITLNKKNEKKYIAIETDMDLDISIHNLRTDYSEKELLNYIDATNKLKYSNKNLIEMNSIMDSMQLDYSITKNDSYINGVDLKSNARNDSKQIQINSNIEEDINGAINKTEQKLVREFPNISEHSFQPFVEENYKEKNNEDKTPVYYTDILQSPTGQIDTNTLSSNEDNIVITSHELNTDIMCEQPEFNRHQFGKNSKSKKRSTIIFNEDLDVSPLRFSSKLKRVKLNNSALKKIKGERKNTNEIAEKDDNEMDITFNKIISVENNRRLKNLEIINSNNCAAANRSKNTGTGTVYYNEKIIDDSILPTDDVEKLPNRKTLLCNDNMNCSLENVAVAAKTELEEETKESNKELRTVFFDRKCLEETLGTSAETDSLLEFKRDEKKTSFQVRPNTPASKKKNKKITRNNFSLNFVSMSSGEKELSDVTRDFEIDTLRYHNQSKNNTNYNNHSWLSNSKGMLNETLMESKLPKKDNFSLVNLSSLQKTLNFGIENSTILSSKFIQNDLKFESCTDIPVHNHTEEISSNFNSRLENIKTNLSETTFGLNNFDSLENSSELSNNTSNHKTELLSNNKSNNHETELLVTSADKIENLNLSDNMGTSIIDLVNDSPNTSNDKDKTANNDIEMSISDEKLMLKTQDNCGQVNKYPRSQRELFSNESFQMSFIKSPFKSDNQTRNSANVKNKIPGKEMFPTVFTHSINSSIKNEDLICDDLTKTNKNRLLNINLGKLNVGTIEEIKCEKIVKSFEEQHDCKSNDQNESEYYDDINKTELSLVQNSNENVYGFVEKSFSQNRHNRKSRCKNCRKSLNESAFKSFILEKVPEKYAEIDWSPLEKFRNVPTVNDVLSRFTALCKQRKSSSFDLKANESCYFPNIPSFKFLLDNLRNQAATEFELKVMLAPLFPMAISFERLLKNKYEKATVPWQLHYHPCNNNCFSFRHYKVKTLKIVITTNSRTKITENVLLESIKLVNEKLYENHFPCDRIIYNEIKLKTSSELSDMYPESNLLSKCLDDLNNIFENAFDLVYHLRCLVIKSRGSIECDESGCIYIRKIQLIKEDDMYTNRVEFQIKVDLIDQISYKNIILPPLSKFSRSLQYLSPGIDFIKTFLENPLQYYIISK